RASRDVPCHHLEKRKPQGSMETPPGPVRGSARIGLQGGMKRNADAPSGCSGIAPDGQLLARVLTVVPQAIQHIERVNERLHGQIELPIRTLDAPAHLEDVN